MAKTSWFQVLFPGSVAAVAAALLAAWSLPVGASPSQEPTSTDDPSSRNGGTDPAAAFGGVVKLTQQAERRLAAANQSPELTGSGPFPAMLEVDLALPNATLYHPAQLDRMGRKKLGVVVWGNGGCIEDGASAHPHLAEIASHGYLVMAPGKPLTGPTALPGLPKPRIMTTSLRDLREMLEWALAENKRRGSPYYRRIDTQAIAVSGTSCGGMQAILMADDPRVRALIIHNSGIFPVLPDLIPLSMHPERMKGIHSPVLFVMGGESDIAKSFGEIAWNNLPAVPAMMANIEIGHRLTLDEPHGGETARVAVDWLEWQLRGDRRASTTFLGPDCGLCRDPKWTVRKKYMR